MPQAEKLDAITDEFAASPGLGDRIDFVVSFLRRRYLIIAICVAAALPLGALYHLTSPSVYTASATMMIETRKNPLQQSQFGDAPLDAAWMESQIGVIKSQSVAAYLVKQLKLADDPDFVRYDPGLFEKILRRLGRSPEPRPEAERVNEAVGLVNGNLDIRRLGQSYMLRIDYRANTPEHATKIANAIVDAYIYDQLNAKYQANRRAGDWLQERLQTLREQAAAAERAVLEFKAKNNIVATGGTLMNERQLSDISGKLAAARAQTSDVQLRLERIGAVRQAYQQEQPTAAVDETVLEATNSGIINSLRLKYLDLINRESDWSSRYGQNHTAVINTRNQIRDIRKSIRDELGRIEETLRSEFEIAKKRQDELEKGLTAIVSQTSETNQAQVALFSLEAAAQSYRKLYDSFLQRHTETVQQQSYPTSDARLLSPAYASKTSPRALQIWLMTIFLGGGAGIGLGALREILDRGFRTREQVRAVLKTECLALVPLFDEVGSKPRSRRSLPIPGWKAEMAARVGESNLSSAPKILRNIIDAPTSPYAEAIRLMKLTIDLGTPTKYTKVVGLTSCFPSEGKSTLALAMALLIAHGGSRVMLVDCDLRNPTLSRTLTPNAERGFLDVIAGRVSLSDVVRTYADGKLSFLPPGSMARLPNAVDFLNLEAAKSLFDTLQLRYDYVIVDLAPAVSTLEVRAASRLVASYLLVIEWGQTKVDAIQYALRNAPELQDRIVGAVLNKVDLAMMSHYDNYGSRYYYGQSYPTVQ